MTDGTFHIAVRALAESIHRRGGLAGPVYGGVSALEGMRLHRRFLETLQENHPEAEIRAEANLSGAFSKDGLELEIGGRCDALLILPGCVRVLEAKSFQGPPQHLPGEGEPVHWAQAYLYGWLVAEQWTDDTALEIGLAYVAQDSDALVELHRPVSREELRRFFETTCDAYLGFAADILRSKKQRLSGGLNCPFPYPRLRPGQKRLMQDVIGTIRQNGSLFVQAPTGTGKTMAVLFPAIRALANGLLDHVFYLTHATSVRLVAAAALDDLERCGLTMKNVILYAKEKLCLCPELYCDARQCPFATAYYDRLPAALHELFLLVRAGREEILDVAERHQVCPFELSLDLSVYCEVIVCDYNHAFDPRVRLVRFFTQDRLRLLLLVDEAHNLPDRSREMYSAELNADTVLRTLSSLGEADPPSERLLRRILAYLERLGRSISGSEAGFDQVERQIGAEAVMIAPDFRGTRQKPDDLITLCRRFTIHCRAFLDTHPRYPERLSVLRGFFELLWFAKVADEHVDAAYVTAARADRGGRAVVRLSCLDASAKLAAGYQGRYPAVFFSATLSPADYYRGLIQGRAAAESDLLMLPSPFPPQNLLTIVCTHVSVRYRQRAETIGLICELVLRAVRRRVGNYLLFVPSFAYLRQLAPLLAERVNAEAIDVILQRQQMDERQRRRFLARFDRFGDKSLLGVAVLGGIFGEGVDLVGEKLSGVIIVGVGLPQVGPEREIMRQYYAQIYGSGYEYAYVFPGFNKVQQAAGRLIRTETDRGFVLLIDDRYREPAYQSLFPPDWQPKPAGSSDEVDELLDDFGF